MISRVLFSIVILQLLTILVGLARAKGLSILLGPAGFGIVSIIDQVALTLMYIAGLGLPFTALRYMARSHSDSLQHFRRTTATFAHLLVCLALLMTALAAFAAKWWPALFGAQLLPYRTPLMLALVGIPVGMLSILFVNMLAAAQRPGAAVGLNLLMSAALSAAAVGGAWLDGLGGLYLTTAIFGAAAIAGSAIYLRRMLGLRLAIRPADVGRQLREQPDIVSSSASVYVQFTAQALGLLAVRYVVLVSLGEASAGLLQASLSIALTVGAILYPMCNLYLAPLVNRQMPMQEKVHATNDFAAKMLFLLMIGALPVVLFPALLLGLLYTPAFVAAATTLFLFVLWQCVFQIANVYQQLLMGLDDMRSTAWAGVIGCGSAALLATALVPAIGLGGAPIALVAGMLVHGAVVAVRLRRRFHVSIPRHVVVRAMYVSSVVLGAGLLFASRPEGSLPEIGTRALFVVVSLGAGFVLVQPEERALVRDGSGWLLRRVGLRTSQPSSSTRATDGLTPCAGGIPARCIVPPSGAREDRVIDSVNGT